MKTNLLPNDLTVASEFTPSEGSSFVSKLLFILLFFAVCVANIQAQPTITSYSPARNTTSSVLSQNIVLGWSTSMNTVTAGNLVVRGSMTGPKYSTSGTIATNGATVTLAHPNFKPGELISVTVTGATSSGGVQTTRATTYNYFAAAGVGSGNFTLSSVATVGSNPHAFALGDFNGDGILDIATASSNNSNVSICIGNGSGGFGAPTNYTVGTYPQSIALGDFNGDGILDFATSNHFADNVSIRLGNGSGGFGSLSNFSAGSYPYSIALGDFNGDGILDIATPNYYDNVVSILLGNGSGGFGSPTNFAVGGDYPVFVASGDFNGDGILDIATVVNGNVNNVSINLGNGLGGFGTAANFTVGNGAQNITLADFNGDGILDFATPNWYDATVSICLGNGSGGFSTAANVSVASCPTSVGVGDFNGDGILDFVAANYNAGTVYIFLGNGAGGFSFASSFGEANPYSVKVGDFNADGILDIAVLDAYYSNSSILLGQAPPPVITSYSPARNTTSSVLSQNISLGWSTNMNTVTAGNMIVRGSMTGPKYSTAGTITTSGATVTLTHPNFKPGELVSVTVTGATSSGGVQTTRATTYNYFAKAGVGVGNFVLSSTAGVGSSPNSVAVGDFNGDGVLDCATANYGGNNVSICLGNGIGGFSTATDYPVGSTPYSVALGDFNGDGILDFAVANYGGNVSICLGNGSGGFGTATNFAVGYHSESLALGDFNGDGILDFAAGNYDGSNVSICLGNGSGGFGTATDYAVGSNSNPKSIAVGDFNGDGILDFATANFSSSNNISICLGNGTGGFGTATNYAVGSYSYSIALGDFNGDGILDFATANYFDNNVSICLGNGTGGFGTATNYAVGTYPASIALGDFNGDGILDFAASNQYDNNVSICLGTGTGGFGTASNFAVGSGPNSVAVGDFNGDGILDFATPNSGGNNVVVLLNQAPPPVITSYSPARNTTNSVLSQNISLGWSTNMNTVTAGNMIVRGSMTGPKYSTAGTITTSGATVTLSHPNFKPGELVSVTVTGATSSGGVQTTLATTYSYFAKSGIATGELTKTNGSYSITSFPREAATGDFNGDGILDLAVANYGSASVSIRLGDGSGGFSGTTEISASTNPFSIKVGDFNNDGNLDFAVVNIGAGSVSVRLGNGLGGFSGSTEITVGTSPASIALGDFNGDGNLDFAVTNSGSNTVSVRLGDGMGGFNGSNNVSVGSSPIMIAVGDYNGDGILDFATANYNSNNVSIKLGDGTGGFTGSAVIAVGSNPYGIATGDFNGDGYLDFATTNNGSNNVSIKLGDGTGGFSGTTLVSVNNPNIIVFGDFNGDGILDFAADNDAAVDGWLYVRFGDGNGGFNGYNISLNNSLASYPGGLTTGDFNGDGILDLAVQHITSSRPMEIFLGTPLLKIVAPNGGESLTAGSTATITWATATTATISQVNLAFSVNNGTSWTTIATATTNTGSYSWTVPAVSSTQCLVQVSSTTNANISDASNSPFTIYTPPPVITSYSPARNTTSSVLSQNISLGWSTTMATVTAGNMIVRGSMTGPKYSTSGTITTNGATVTLTHPNFKPGELVSVTVTGATSSGGVQTTRATTYNYFAKAGAGSGRFSTTSSAGTGATPLSICTGDFNGDGILDLATADYGSNQISIFLGNGNGTFTTTATAGTGGSPAGICTGDFNGDGVLDLATADQGSSRLTVFLGNGNGTFTTTATAGTGNSPISICTGDFNGDGILDLATADYGSNRITVFIGNGNGRFTTTATAGTGTNPYSVCTGDFNGDGILDLATADIGSNQISIFLGNGNGRFTTTATAGTGAGPLSVCTGDFNGDGILDLATADQGPDQITVFLGNGNGQFTTTATARTGIDPRNICTGDFNGDGILDIATVDDGTSNQISILRGNGDGTFTTTATAGTGAAPISVCTGDFNGDGILDLAITKGDYQIQVFLGNTPPTISTTATAITFNQDNTTTIMVSVSDAQQATSALVLTATSSNISLIPNANIVRQGATSATTVFLVTPVTNMTGTANITITVSDGMFTASTTFSVTVRAIPSISSYSPARNTTSSVLSQNIQLGWSTTMATVTAGNMIVRGSMTGPKYSTEGTITTSGATVMLSHPNFKPGELVSVTVTGATSSGGVQTTRATTYNYFAKAGVGTGSFTLSSTAGVGAQPYSVAVGDFNGDGILDFAAANYLNSNVSICLGNGSGGFGSAVNYTVGSHPISIALGDFNGDGILDFVAANYNDNNVSICLGNGSGGFGSATNYTVGSYPQSVALGDFNGDGILDFATANAVSNNVSICLGNGSGGFGSAINFTVGSGPQSVALGDFNGDGILDFAVPNYYNNNVSIRLGNGSGGFGSATNYAVGNYYPRSIALGDFNGDGILDFATANYNDVSICLGNGSGGFGSATNYSVGSSPFSIAVGDFNGDGKLDFAVPNYNGGDVSILLGNGSGGFGSATNYAVGSGPGSVAVGDFNGDGVLDFMAANINSDNVSILLGQGPLTITYPNGGQTLSAGSSTSITWTTTLSTISTVDLAYSVNNGTSWTTIATVTTNTGSYSWTVPAVSSTQCLVRVSSTTNASISDASNAPFTISMPSLSATTSTITATPLTLKVGQTTTLTVTFRDASGNLVTSGGSLSLSLSATFGNISASTITPSGQTTATLTYTAGTNLAGTMSKIVTIAIVGNVGQANGSVTFTITPNNAVSSTSTIIADGNTGINAGKTTTATITFRDVYGNQTNTGSVTLSPIAFGSVTGGLTTTANAPGTTRVITYVAGTYLAGLPFTTTTLVGLSNSVTFTIYPDFANVAYSTISANGNTTLIAGTSTTATITFRDQYFNQATIGSITFTQTGFGSVIGGLTVTPNTLSSTRIITYVAGTNLAGQQSSTTTLGGMMNMVTFTIVPPAPTVTISGNTSFCTGSFTQLTATGANTYIWSNGSTNSTITVTVGGTYTVTGANSGGSSSTSVTVTANPIPSPMVNPAGTTTFCAGGSVQLNASPPSMSSFLWSNGATTQSITVTAGGNYYVTVVNFYGCSATSGTVVVTVNPLPTPTITANGPTTFCAGGNVVLSASTSASYLWSNGATTQSINVNSTGIFSVTIVNGNGCTGTSASTIVIVNSLPNMSISGSTSFCAGGFTQLTASPGMSAYYWSNGATTQSINVSVAGNYSVTGANIGGCLASTSVTVTSNPLPTPTITANGTTTFCAGNSVILTASTSASYLWSNSATTQSINVNLSGSYNVTAVNSNGCTGTSSNVTVTVNSLPSVSISGNTSFCAGSSTQLTASGGSTYYWSTGSTGASINISVSGTYTVTGANANGCLNSTSITVTSISAPNTPTLTSPSNSTASISTNPTLSWQTVSGSVTYTLQVATQSSFSALTFNQSGLSSTSQSLTGLSGLTQYFWRVQAVNSCTSGTWSSTFAFTTVTTTSATTPPSTWDFTSNTGQFANIIIPTTANPRINTTGLSVGDAIGVFYTRNGSLVCGGWGYWQGQNMALTVWGDNDQTPLKDGFTAGEIFTYKIWKESENKEYGASVTYSQGNGLFTSNSYYVLSSLIGFGSQDISLMAGYNYISSYINPTTPAMDVLCTPIVSGMTLMRNGSGLVYFPFYGINQIGNWNILHGYQVYMTTSATLTIQGSLVTPEATSSTLIGTQWNIVSYLRTSAMSVPTAISSLGNGFIIVKNGLGQSCIPTLSINQIGSMQPGQGYWVYVANTGSLTYPSNSSPRAGENDWIDNSETKHYSIDFQLTSNNETFIVKCPGAKDNDEIAVWNSSNQIVGTGLVIGQRAVLSVWGKDEMSGEVNGAKEGEFLRLTLWHQANDMEISLPVSSVINILESGRTEIGAIYNVNAVLEIATQLPEKSSENAQLSFVPNPSTGFAMISYFVPTKENVQIEVFDVLSQKIATLVSGEETAGMKNIGIDMSEKPSGTYFVRLVMGKEIQTIVVEIVK